ncbi:IS5/IS1182 family transposase [Sutcliffiella horikoshii]|uniref:IS5/IS1182 family transposase n=4 Tax=Sutcliffiella horikoshii TaxID=79883 RepID=A0ABM6KKC6_9BACI|nr:IS1182 family transposase [Sutcliffiella horikoshii]ART76784.1 IS5/IS1182 family transposase [Sutcliffiella horikoshii]ART76821.1 IS5/IS1182 family transposase [Sutcliffiella horikoshii]ART76938.1 IS5/IS1182 family transposase [Sutcliffiella horikoshii]ART77852.1 IS5/IS1182 family transposase [Sutcliffiella horikoshii]ART78005.1 IS5/IS1182 family transposase [Sutcliffiella horikoshii]
MISNQESFNLSPFSAIYDIVVPKNNMLRQINELVDFSFILDELKTKYCLDNGRNAIPPIRMFKYLLLKSIYDLSDVDVVDRSQYDMSFKYFLEMAPEDRVIDSSSLTKFRKLRLKDVGLLDMLIEKTVEIALEKGIIKTNTIIIDATHSKARYNQKSATEFLQEKSKNVRRAIYQIDESLKSKLPQKTTSNDVEEELAYCRKVIDTVDEIPQVASIPAVREKLNILKEVVEDYTEQISYSNDPDARKGHKTADSSFFGFKTHIAISEERIITAAVITTGEKSDGKYLPELIEKTVKAGMEVDTAIGDTAYSEKNNISYTKENNIALISKLNPVIQGTRTKEDEFEFNKDAGMYVCRAGHLAFKLRRQGKKNVAKNRRETYYFDIEKCKVCPFKEGCYTEGAKSRTYSITIKSTEHKEQEEFQNTEGFKEKAKSRYKIEAKNSELKHRHGYDTASSAGLLGMEVQGATAIFAVNLKRILKLINEK